MIILFSGCDKVKGFNIRIKEVINKELDRYREVRKYNNLLIFIDEFDTIGSYIEIEYQDSDNDEAYKFIELLDLDNKEQDKYGDIVRNLISSDDNLKKKMIKKLERYSE